jgi:hypothetical protein
MLQALGILLLVLLTAPTADRVTTADAEVQPSPAPTAVPTVQPLKPTAMSNVQQPPAPAAVWRPVHTIPPSPAASAVHIMPPSSAPTAVPGEQPLMASVTAGPIAPSPCTHQCPTILTVLSAVTALPANATVAIATGTIAATTDPTPTVIHAMPTPPAPTAMWQPVRTKTNAITAVAVATDAMSDFTVTNDCGHYKHQIDDAWGLLRSYLIISHKASLPIPDQLAVQANDTADQSLAPQTGCAGKSQLRHMSAWQGWTPGIMFTGLLSPFTLLTVRVQLTRLYHFPTLPR